MNQRRNVKLVWADIERESGEAKLYAENTAHY